MRGNYSAPLLWLQRVKRLAIAYQNRNRNRDCGGGRYVGYQNHNEDFDIEAVKSGEDVNFLHADCAALGTARNRSA